MKCEKTEEKPIKEMKISLVKDSIWLKRSEQNGKKITSFTRLKKEVSIFLSLATCPIMLLLLQTDSAEVISFHSLLHVLKLVSHSHHSTKSALIKVINDHFAIASSQLSSYQTFQQSLSSLDLQETTSNTSLTLLLLVSFAGPSLPTS